MKYAARAATSAPGASYCQLAASQSLRLTVVSLLGLNQLFAVCLDSCFWPHFLQCTDLELIRGAKTRCYACESYGIADSCPGRDGVDPLTVTIAVTTAINIEGEGGGGGEISLLLWGNRPLPTFP